MENNKIMKTVFYKNRENDENQVKLKIMKMRKSKMQSNGKSSKAKNRKS